ncbi:MAG TPA: TIGR03663 family protein, partial [Thermomicrobiales bacterium]|nr:TIGR03663 family protein [Thermomicrobiales bacterium]
WLLLAGRLTYGEFTPSSDPGGWTRALPESALASWWLLAVPPAIALAALIVGLATRGTRRAGEAALVALVAALALLQIHTAWRLTYLEGDVPKDMLVYTQTSPDVTRVVDELTALSETMTGGKGLEIWYDDNNGVSWPMQWYLRDFPNRHLYGSSLTTTPTAPIVLAGGDNVGAVQAAMQGYTAQPYVLRWWFPEEIYRNFAIAPELRPGRSAWASVDQPHGIGDILGSVWTSARNLFTPHGQAQVYRLLMYRDLPDRIDSYGFTLYIRNDLLPLYNQLRY